MNIEDLQEIGRFQMKRSTDSFVEGSVSKVKEVKQYYPETYHGTLKSGEAVNIQIASPHNQENFIADHSQEKVKARIWITDYKNQKARCYTLTDQSWYEQTNGNLKPQYYEGENTYSWDLLPPKLMDSSHIEGLKKQINNE